MKHVNTMERPSWTHGFASPGPDRQLGVQNAGGNTELLQEEFEPVAPVHGSHKQQRLTLDQPQLQQRVDEQELVLLIAFDAVLLQLAAVRQLRALQLEDDLNDQSTESGQGQSQHVKHCESPKTKEVCSPTDAKPYIFKSAKAQLEVFKDKHV